MNYIPLIMTYKRKLVVREDEISSVSVSSVVDTSLDPCIRRLPVELLLDIFDNFTFHDQQNTIRLICRHFRNIIDTNYPKPPRLSKISFHPVFSELCFIPLDNSERHDKSSVSVDNVVISSTPETRILGLLKATPFTKRKRIKWRYAGVPLSSIPKLANEPATSPPLKQLVYQYCFCCQPSISRINLHANNNGEYITILQLARAMVTAYNRHVIHSDGQQNKPSFVYIHHPQPFSFDHLDQGISVWNAGTRGMWCNRCSGFHDSRAEYCELRTNCSIAYDKCRLYDDLRGDKMNITFVSRFVKKAVVDRLWRFKNRMWRKWMPGSYFRRSRIRKV